MREDLEYGLYVPYGLWHADIQGHWRHQRGEGATGHGLTFEVKFLTLGSAWKEMSPCGIWPHL